MPSAKKLFSFSKAEITEFFDSGKRVFRSEYVDTLILPAKKEFGRLFIAIPKHLGNAPARNKIRRQLKAIFYEQKMFESKFDTLILVKKPILALSFAELKEFMIKAVL